MFAPPRAPVADQACFVCGTAGCESPAVVPARWSSLICGPESQVGDSRNGGGELGISEYTVALALAMQLNGAGLGSLGSLGSLPILLLFMVAMYFLLVRPNQQKQKTWQEMLGKLKAGDQVTTNGGLRGTVLSLKEDTVIVRVQPDGTKLEFVKSAIAAVTTAGE